MHFLRLQISSPEHDLKLFHLVSDKVLNFAGGPFNSWDRMTLQAEMRNTLSSVVQGRLLDGLLVAWRGQSPP